MTDREHSLLEELRSEIDQDRPLASEVESLESDAESAKNKDRSVIARWLVLAFIATLLFLIVYVLISPLFLNDLTEIRSASEQAITIISSILLPVVTLVLGYHFGTNDGQSQ